MIKLLQSSWLASMGGGLAYLMVTMLAWHAPEFTQRDSEHDSEGEGAGPSWFFQSTEMDQLIEELKREKEVLAKRKTELDSLAERLRTERLELNQVTQTVYQLQTQFDSNVVHVRAEELPNLKKNVRIYLGMEPDVTAKMFKQMDDQALLKILALMKETELAPILEIMARGGETDSKRVTDLLDRLRLTLTNPTPPKKSP